MPFVTSASEMADILRRYRRITVVGLSASPWRPSHEVSAYMQAQGYVITPVNPTLAGQEVLGRTVYASLAELPEPPEIVDVFRRPEFLPEVVDAAIAAHAPVLWTQLGVVHPKALARASEAGLLVVQNRCIKVEHMQLGIGHVAPAAE